MGKFPALYKVEVYDESSNSLKTIHGLLYVDSFADAAKTLEQYYGLNETESMKIELFEEDLIELPEDKELIKKIKSKLLGEINEKL